MGRKFIVYTDHKPLEHFNIKNCNDPELRQILNYISQFELDIIYNPGKKNLEADCLSRNLVLEDRDDNDEHLIVKIVNFVNVTDIVNDIKQLTLDINCDIKNDIIFKTLNKKKKIFVSEKFGIELIKAAHEKRGHVGVKQLTLTIRKTDRDRCWHRSASMSIITWFTVQRFLLQKNYLRE